MKDLFLLTADADALAFMRSILVRYESLGIRPITVEPMRHYMKDAGVIKDGPETARLYKGKCDKALILWDYHGSGHEARYQASESAAMVQQRLDGMTWTENSGAVTLVPELEEWLWCTVPPVAQYFAVPHDRLTDWMGEYAAKRRLTVEEIIKKYPKELFEYLCVIKMKRSISPRDFEEIGKVVSINSLAQSNSFAKILELLRGWFPLQS